MSGKGLPAALYGALAVGTCCGVHKTGLTPARVLYLLNEKLLLRGIAGHHSAVQYAVFNPDVAEMRIVGAGMPGPLLLREQRCQTLQVPGIPPGLFPNVTHEEFTAQLQPGDSLFFCTDGLTEARNLRDGEFGLEGLEDICRWHYSETPLDLLGHVFFAIQEFTRDCRQWDDMTALSSIIHRASASLPCQKGHPRSPFQFTLLSFSRNKIRYGFISLGSP